MSGTTRSGRSYRSETKVVPVNSPVSVIVNPPVAVIKIHTCTCRKGAINKACKSINPYCTFYNETDTDDE